MLLLQVQGITRLIFAISDVLVYFFGGPDYLGVCDYVRVVVIEHDFAHLDALFTQFEYIFLFEGITL